MMLHVITQPIISSTIITWKIRVAVTKGPEQREMGCDRGTKLRGKINNFTTQRVAQPFVLFFEINFSLEVLDPDILFFSFSEPKFSKKQLILVKLSL